MFYPLHDNHISSNDRSHLDVQASIPSALAAGFNVHAPLKLKLTSHSLGSMCVWELSPLESPSFQTVLTILRRLLLSMLFDRAWAPDAGTFDAHWCHFWGTLYPRTILAPTQHTLTELTIHTDIPVGASSGLSLAGLHFPLCALSLRGHFFHPSVGVEHFILRHAATIAQLQVIACKLPAPAPANLSLSYFRTISSRDEGLGSVPGGWDRIWDCFAVELTAVALDVDTECWYIEPRSFWEVSSSSRVTWLTLQRCDASI